MYRPLLVAAALVVIVDQVTKSWALARLQDRDRIDVIEGIFSFRLTFNPGGAFGFGKEFPEFFLVATIVVVIGIVAWAARSGETALAVPLGLVLGGGIGNLIDRVIRDFDGRVVDFIDLHVWPVFNIADSCIVIGVAWVLISGLRADRDEEPAEPSESAP